MTTETLTVSGNWVCPAGVTSVQVECVGAGGGGASGNLTNRGGGGGGGAYASSTVAVVPGTSYPYVIGTGGSNVNGGATSFDTTSVIADGGKKGIVGGAGGVAGSAAASTGTTTTSGTAGTAGNGNTGAGGAGNAGTSPGGGGSGGGTTVTTTVGGSGADGQIVLTYTPSAVTLGTGGTGSLGKRARDNMLTGLTKTDPVAESNVDLYVNSINAGLTTTDVNKSAANQYWEYLRSL
jgi:hypothetical protein